MTPTVYVGTGRTRTSTRQRSLGDRAYVGTLWQSGLWPLSSPPTLTPGARGVPARNTPSWPDMHRNVRTP